MLNNKIKKVEFIQRGTKVMHCHGVSERSSECRVCGHWIEHWTKYIDGFIDVDELYVANKCCICSKEDKVYNSVIIVGTHVRIDGYSGEWIIPTCNIAMVKARAKIMILKL